MRRSTLAITSALILPLGLALSACNEEEPAPETETSQEPEETEETEETEATEETDDGADPAASGDYTEPGTELSMGETATVSFTYGTDSTGDIGLTLDEITEGKAADIADVKNADGYIPFYLHFTVTGGADAENLANASVGGSEIDGLLAGDQKAGSLITMGGFEPCENDSLPDDFAEGDTHEMCVPALAPEGAEVVGAQYAVSDTEYDQFDGDPILWK